MAIDELGTVPAVWGVMNYLSEESTVLRRFTAPGRSVNTGLYDSYAVQVYDARAVHRPFTLERNGFELVHRPTRVEDFTDRDEIARVYDAEIEEFVRLRLGADRVALLGATLRRAADPGAHDSQPAAGLVHIDFSPEGAAAHAAETYERHFPDGPGYARAVSTSCWRVFSPPPQDWPLAVCDFRSLGDDEGLPNTLYFVDAIPSDPFGPIDGSPRALSGSEFHYRPSHRWYFYPDMTRDELLLFVLHDSDHSRAWRVMHSAFLDAEAHAASPRHSIEYRTVAYFR
ncbi:hypothetical protein K0817_007000 [Microbacterium sp. HD4P20]|uniref:CmcJ/NvfI family oxidoreductase n=1 Tax=Microbacterium sp. HD4P20 TaxID=2864874 RepID=UPI001C63E72E|nr:CmcJ/NvfI family oxidoreductase [Microbacterium sp. HD4P20]MCP2636315.1 hypothetical protein [Microbacterium sp. HD4P20]